MASALFHSWRHFQRLARREPPKNANAALHSLPRARHCLRHIVFGATALLAAGCQQQHHPFRDEVKAAGATAAITIHGIEGAAARAAFEAAARDLRFVEDSANPWQPGPMGRINQGLAATEPFSANPSMLPLIRDARRLAHRTAHRFNPAAGGLQSVWGFDTAPDAVNEKPSEDRLWDLVAQNPTMEDVVVDGIRIRSINPAVRLDLRDFAVGYALDTALQRLRENGAGAALIESSRFALTAGALPGRRWRAAVPMPEGMVEVQLLPDEALYTVGPIDDGVSTRLDHPVIDPATGYPRREVKTVSVIASSAAEAAALATALFMPDADWREAAREIGAERALRVHADGLVETTPGFEERRLP